MQNSRLSQAVSRTVKGGSLDLADLPERILKTCECCMGSASSVNERRCRRGLAGLMCSGDSSWSVCERGV